MVGASYLPVTAVPTEPQCSGATPEILTFADADGCYTTTYGWTRMCCWNNTCWTEHSVGHSEQWCPPD